MKEMILNGVSLNTLIKDLNKVKEVADSTIVENYIMAMDLTKELLKSKTVNDVNTLCSDIKELLAQIKLINEISGVDYSFIFDNEDGKKLTIGDLLLVNNNPLVKFKNQSVSDLYLYYNSLKEEVVVEEEEDFSWNSSNC